MTPSDEHNDPVGEAPLDWAGRYRAGQTPWDLGAAHPELTRRLQDGSLAPPASGGRALVPGAGRGHDALALARRGWTVVALDLVETLADDLAGPLSRSGGRFVAGDALEFEDEPFDLIWDHTFFCAIEPADRARWGQRAGELLRPGAAYAALVFPFGKPAAEGGPPHGMSGDHLPRCSARVSRSSRRPRPCARSLRVAGASGSSSPVAAPWASRRPREAGGTGA